MSTDTKQHPVDSPFGYRTTAKEALAHHDLSGKTAVVTGGYSGIGLETVKALAGAGAQVMVAGRRQEVADEKLAGIPNTSFLMLDLGDPASIDAFADSLAQQISKIDLLINNAGIMANPLTRDARGYESQFATNHLGHFQMTARLWPLVKAAGAGARIVVLSSVAHRMNGLDLDDLNWESRDYHKWFAYGQAKTANALFALHLDKLTAPHGIHAYSVHPGGIMTPLQRHLSMEEQTAMGWYDEKGNQNEMFKTEEEGASTTIFAATSPLLEDKGGVYLENCNVAEQRKEGMPDFVGAYPHIRDEATAETLWKKSEELTGVTFTG
ncbi:MAG TPA: oxidoreductase [Cytophagales bacterium]|nr:oxidoreductase [Cytophagales bacterium]